MTIQKILVPDMGDFKDVEVIEVLVKKGQEIKKNDSLITLESDKSSVEVPSTHEGKVEKINVSVGDKINKGDLILTLESKQESNKPVKEKSKKEPVKEKKQIKEVVQFSNQHLMFLLLERVLRVQKLESLQENWEQIFLKFLAHNVLEGYRRKMLKIL